ncbi:type 1 glutamine amidotransferase [Okibacterium endophyticum]
MTVRILELYPSELNLNGDAGNRMALARRMRLAGIDVDELSHHPGDEFPSAVDIVTIGTGSSSAVRSVAPDVERIAPALRSLVDDGVVLLAAGAGFHLLSRRIRMPDGVELEGAGVFDAAIDCTAPRVITEAFGIESEFGTLIGTENHTARSVLAPGVRPLGKVLNGRGNGDGRDGAVVGNSYGTHAHGPVLVVNPRFTDHLIGLACKRTGDMYSTTEAHNELDRVVAAARAILEKKLPA